MNRNFARCFVYLALFLSGLLLGGCGPEKTVQWSPDGSQAALLGGDELRLCDDRGNITQPVMKKVERFVWMPDSRRIVTVTKREIAGWEELVKAAPIGFDEKRIIAAVLVAREELLRHEGDLDQLKPSNAAGLTMEQWIAGALYLKLQADAQLREKLGKDWKELEELKADVYSIQVVPASLDAARSGRTLFETLQPIQAISIAGDGNVLALVDERTPGFDGGSVRSLSIIPADGPGKPVQVADRVSTAFDWSLDGRSLFFARQAGSDSEGLGKIARRTVRDAKGDILQPMPDATDLAAVIFSDRMKVRCLKDGRILLAASEVSLPVPVREIPNRMTLFYMNPADHVVVSRALPRQVDPKLPDRVDLFELSPDQKRVSVPGGKGRVSVVSLDSGEVVSVVEADAGDLRMIPVWRNSDQLCLAAPAASAYGSAKRGEVVLWSARGAVPISRHWPDDMVSGVIK